MFSFCMFNEVYMCAHEGYCITVCYAIYATVRFEATIDCRMPHSLALSFPFLREWPLKLIIINMYVFMYAVSRGNCITEVRDKLSGVGYFLLLWVLGNEFRSSGLCDKYFHPLNHLTSPFVPLSFSCWKGLTWSSSIISLIIWQNL